MTKQRPGSSTFTGSTRRDQGISKTTLSSPVSTNVATATVPSAAPSTPNSPAVKRSVPPKRTDTH